jgi:SAM-dependent methyltransferase
MRRQKPNMDIRKHNRFAWDKQVERGSPWTSPVDSDAVRKARRGNWAIRLTPTKPVPKDWIPDPAGKKILCLASGGGQQGPILAAAGAEVTVFDNSPKQLERDRAVADREGPALATVEGDMADLSAFAEGKFDWIVHPVSNVFVADVNPVWREAFRVLRRGGVLIAGFVNPAFYIFDFPTIERDGRLEVRHPLPYSDMESLPEEQRRRYREEGIPFEFSHTLEDQIGGQIAVGLRLVGFYEDRGPEGDANLLRKYMATYIATRAVKP